jgi:N-acetylmuramoyl-L-alanine amidase
LQKVVYRVQFASYKREKSLDFRKFRGLQNIWVYEHAGQYKYTAGKFETLENAQQHKKEMISSGYKDSFIVAFLDDERISLEKARSVLNSNTVDLQ